MKIAVITLRPRTSYAIGGEDQVGPYLCRILERKGYDVHLFSEHESAVLRESSFDLIISNGAQTFIGDHPRSVFWHFNERLDLKNAIQIRELGFRYLASNQTLISKEQVEGIQKSELEFFFLPLAADRSMIAEPRFESNPYQSRFAYIGNWNDYKGHKIEEWLEPVKDNLSIFGGVRWADHPTLSGCYQGIYPKDAWRDLVNVAPVWIAFRSPQQAEWGMVGDRIYWLMAAGVDCIVSDLPKNESLFDRFGDLVYWQEVDCLNVFRGYYPRNGKRFQDFVLDGNLYEDRLNVILERLA